MAVGDTDDLDFRLVRAFLERVSDDLYGVWELFVVARRVCPSLSNEALRRETTEVMLWLARNDLVEIVGRTGLAVSGFLGDAFGPLGELEVRRSLADDWWLTYPPGAAPAENYISLQITAAGEKWLSALDASSSRSGQV